MTETQQKDFAAEPAANTAADLDETPAEVQQQVLNEPSKVHPTPPKQPQKKTFFGGVGGWFKNNFVGKPGQNEPNPKYLSWEPPHPRWKS